MTTYTNRLRQSANIRFGLAAAILILAGIFLFWPNYQQLMQSRASISSLNEEIENVQLELEIERSEYRLLKNNYARTAAIDESTIATILPVAAAETNIVRMLEQKVNEMSNNNSSLILESVNIGSASLEKDTDYFALPIKISLTGTKEKLLSFLHYLEKTGSTSENENPTRLIEVQDINLQLSDRGAQSSALSDEVKMEISANTYFLPSTQKITTK